MAAEIPRCPICAEPLVVRLATGRKSGKAFVMVMCPRDGRHFRGFISDRAYVKRFLDSLEATQHVNDGPALSR